MGNVWHDILRKLWWRFYASITSAILPPLQSIKIVYIFFNFIGKKLRNKMCQREKVQKGRAKRTHLRFKKNAWLPKLYEYWC